VKKKVPELRKLLKNRSKPIDWHEIRTSRSPSKRLLNEPVRDQSTYVTELHGLSELSTRNLSCVRVNTCRRPGRTVNLLSGRLGLVVC
jgi:hypothetical protein